MNGLVLAATSTGGWADFILTCLVVFISILMTFFILLQEGKGGGLTALGGTKAAGVEGVTNPIRRATAWLAAIMLVLLIVLGIMHKPAPTTSIGGGDEKSAAVGSAETPAEAPATPAAVPVPAAAPAALAPAPAAHVPAAAVPATDASKAPALKAGTLKTETPKTEVPNPNGAKTEAPKTEAPKPSEAKTEAPKAAPKTEAPPPAPAGEAKK